jgi:hypothetical protein
LNLEQQSLCLCLTLHSTSLMSGSWFHTQCSMAMAAKMRSHIETRLTRQQVRNACAFIESV